MLVVLKNRDNFQNKLDIIVRSISMVALGYLQSQIKVNDTVLAVNILTMVYLNIAIVSEKKLWESIKTWNDMENCRNC